MGHARAQTGAREVVVGRRALSQIMGRGASKTVGVLVSVSDKPYTIRAVMPSDFAFPDDQVGLWVPSPPSMPGYSKVIARLKPGVTLDQVRDDANRIRLELDQTNTAVVSVAVLGESVVGSVRRVVIAALAGGVLVLLVACANVATLFIGRDVARQRELAARMALGATASQLVRSVLVETSLIALIGALIGLALGAATLQIFDICADA